MCQRNPEWRVHCGVGPAADGSSKLSAAIKKAVGGWGSVPELAPRTVVEVLDLVTTAEAEEVEPAVRTHFGESARELQVCLTERAFRGATKAFVGVTEELARKILQAGHLKVG